MISNKIKIILGISLLLLFIGLLIYLFVSKNKNDCNNNSDCSSTQICKKGKCQNKGGSGGCKNNSDCSNTQICKNGKCQNKGGGGGCKNNSDCSNTQICKDGQCQDSGSSTVGPDINKQLEKIQIANGGSSTLWIAYMGNVNKECVNSGYNKAWPTYPSDYKGIKKTNQAGKDLNIAGSIRIDPGQYVYFPVYGKAVSACRLWPMLGCDDNGQFCKIGGSGDGGYPNGGLAGSGYDNGGGKGYIYTMPIDSKFEFTFADETNPNPKWPLDSFNTSAVDGLTLNFLYEYYNHKTQQEYGVSCGMPDSECPASQNIYENCSSKDCKNPSYTVDLKYTNKDGNYMGCKSPCSYMTIGNKYNFPFCSGSEPSVSKPCCPHNGDTQTFPGAAYYCCGGPAGLSPQCNAGPVNETEYCKSVHKQCKITKDPNKENIGKAGIYCQAYDDATGLSNLPAGPNKFKMTFNNKGMEWAK